MDNSPAAVGSSGHSSSRAKLCASGSQKEARVPEGDEDTNPQSLVGPRDSNLYLRSNPEASKSSVTGEQEGSICIL